MNVLHDLSLTANPGQVIAFVGPSGAGKSTIANLIPRFYDVTEGAITIDDIDIRDVTIKSLREQIGVVPQETMLFSGTIKENIRYGRLDATDEEIIEAAKAANAHNFIMNLADGYDTKIGERGITLSGGQRQRMAIARAILKNPRILILDEATSALDSETEKSITNTILRLKGKMTIIAVAHRLSTLKKCDFIFEFNNGKVDKIDKVI